MPVADLVLAVAALVLVLAGAVLLVRRSRRLPAAPPPAKIGSGAGFTCPFCKREYDPARTGGRCPACGAASPRR